MHRAVAALRLLAVAALAPLAGAGCGSEASAPKATAGATAPKAIHGLYPAAGARLFLDCRGSGPRTVVLDSGLGVDSTSTRAAVRPAVARFARVCQCDRAGMASSPPGPRPRTSQRMVDELRALLRAARVAPPYVLVGASFGGLNAQLFASEHRARWPAWCSSTACTQTSTGASSRSSGAARAPSAGPRWRATRRACASPTSWPATRRCAPTARSPTAEDQPELVIAAIREVLSG